MERTPRENMKTQLVVRCVCMCVCVLQRASKVEIRPTSLSPASHQHPSPASPEAPLQLPTAAAPLGQENDHSLCHQCEDPELHERAADRREHHQGTGVPSGGHHRVLQQQGRQHLQDEGRGDAAWAGGKLVTFPDGLGFRLRVVLMGSWYGMEYRFWA